MADPIDNLTIDVDALIAVGVDPASVSNLVSSFEKFGRAAGGTLAKGVEKGTGNVFDDISRTVAQIPQRAARDKAWGEYARALARVAGEAQRAMGSMDAEARKANAAALASVKSMLAQMSSGVAAATNSVSSAARSAAAASAAASTKAAAAASAATAATATATSAAATASSAAASGARKAAAAGSAAVDDLVADLQKFYAATKHNEDAWRDLSAVIVASVNKAARELSKEIVGEQSKQQAVGVAKAQAQQAAQAAKDAARAALQQQRASDREAEQDRAAATRSRLAHEKAALAQQNAVVNAANQTQLVSEKGHQQRRTAIVQAGLLATRSLYQSIASGTSSVVSGAYHVLAGVYQRGEAAISAVVQRGHRDRLAQTERAMAQTAAEVRRQQGAIAAATAQLSQGGVLGALTGQSAAGALLRGGMFGGAALGGAFGLRQLVNEASGFESNLNVFAAMNDELGDTPGLMAEISRTALDLGSDIALPGVSAADAAAAITALAKTGLSLEDSLDSARGALLLAGVAGVDFTESARTIGSTLNALGLEGRDATAVVDGLTAALKEGGGATFDELRQAQSQALLVFKQGFKFADDPVEIMNNLNASLALLSRNALRGSDAGTSLKTFVSSLSGISGSQQEQIAGLLAAIGESGNFLFDASGRARGYAESIDLVRRAFLNLDPAERGVAIRDIFGSDAQRAAEVFVNTSREELDSLVNDIRRASGITEKLAKAQNQGVKAAADAFVSTIETIFIVGFGKVNVALGNLLSGIAAAIDKVVFDEAFEGLRGILAGIGAALASIAGAKAGVEVLRVLGVLVSGLASPLGVVVAALSAVGAAIGFVLAKSEPLRDALAGLFTRLRKDATSAASGPLGTVAAFFDDMRKKAERAAEVVGFFVALLIDSDMRRRFIEWQNLPASVEHDGLLGWFLRMQEEIPKLFRTVRSTFSKVVAFVQDVASSPAFELLRSSAFGAAGAVAALVVGVKGLSVARSALTGLRTAAGVLTAFASPFGVAALAVGGLVAGFTVLYQKSKPFKDLIDGIADVLRDAASVVVKAAAPAFEAFTEVVKEASSGALAVFFEALRDLADFLASPAFVDALMGVGAFVGSVFASIAGAFQKVVTFFVALARTIHALGLFEGIRQGAIVVFEGVIGLVGGMFSRIGDVISSKFAGVQWEQVATGAAAGIFSFFRKVGDAVGRFVGSKEFLTTLAVALGTLAGVLVSAGGGLITGLLEGLRDSDAGEKILDFFRGVVGDAADEIEGAAPLIAEAIKTATVDGLKLTFSAAFPPELFRRAITDPFGSALGAVVLLVEAVFIGKIVQKFVAGMGTMVKSFQGLQRLPQILGGGLGAAVDDIGKTGRVARDSAVDIRKFSDAYGPLAGRLAGYADKVSVLTKTQSVAAATTSKVTAKVDGQTQALKINEAAARAQAGQIAKADESATKFEGTLATIRNNIAGMTASAGGGALAGFGIGTALTADNPLGVISGITEAIGGIGTVAVTTAAVVASSGLTAGLLTGGVGLAVMAITAAVTYFTRNKGEIDRAVAEAEQAAKEFDARYGNLFKSVVGGPGGAAQDAVEAFAEFKKSGKDAYSELTEAAETFGVSVQDVLSGVINGGDILGDMRTRASSELTANASEIAALERELAGLGSGRGPSTGPGKGAPSWLFSEEGAQREGRRREIPDEIAALQARNEELIRGADTVRQMRGLYQQVAQDASDELMIRDAIADMEYERISSVDQTLTRQRETQRALEAQVEALLTIADLETGRTDAERAGRELRQGLRGVVDEFMPGEDGKAPTASFFAQEGSEAYDNALDAIESYRSRVAVISQEVADSSATQDEYNKKIREQAALYEQVLREAGASPEAANQIIQGLFNGFVDGNEVVEAFIRKYEGDIGKLKAELSAPWVKKVTADIDDGPAKEAIRRFIEAPDAKNVEVLMDLGVPKELMAAFLADPSPKTIQPIIAALTPLDEQRLGAITAPVTKKVTLVIPKTLEEISPIFRPIFQGQFPKNKYGSVINEPTLTWVGEEHRKEVIIPLTMPSRAAQLYEQSGLAGVLARAGVAAPGVQSVLESSSAGPSAVEFDRLVQEVHLLRSDLREDMDTRRDNVFMMESVEDPYPSVRQRAATLRRPKKRR